MSLINRLSLAALALPGIVAEDAYAGRVDETFNADFQYAHYEESNDRMEVDVFNLTAVAPIGKNFTASLDLVRDTMSGASPVLNIKDGQGNVQQFLSSASITDERDALNASLSYAFDDVDVSLGGGVSSENDYFSGHVNVGVSWALNKKLTTLNLTGSVAFDEITATGRPEINETKTSQKYLLGITQILNKDSLIQSNMTFAYHNGFLSDPYKRAYIEDTATQVNDARPGNKFQWAWLTRYVHHFKAANKAALHADYRLYIDDWGVDAHTVELSWFQPIADGWQIIPRFRYYTQDKADFYQATFTSSNLGAVHSSDYRLAGFGSIGAGIKLTKSFLMSGFVKEVKLQAAFDYNDRKASYQIGGDNSGSFDDYSFYMVTASINARF